MKPRILLVDDDRDLLRGTSLRLQSAGYEAMEAHDGRQGVASAERRQPDAILLDVRMPEMDGLQTLAELQAKENTKNIPIVMISASIVDQQRALDAGARFFIKKPYQNTTLMAAVQTAIAEKATQTAAHDDKAN